MRKVTDRKYSKFNPWAQFLDKMKSLDMFGLSINFTYENQQKYNTLEGACLTIFIVLAMIIISGIYFNNVINRTE